MEGGGSWGMGAEMLGHGDGDLGGGVLKQGHCHQAETKSVQVSVMLLHQEQTSQGAINGVIVRPLLPILSPEGGL